ncbi:MAG: DUF3307 domain-containing protein [Acidobacteria bacterium]|nr:DUF3307 domain-containing protein [Acidobacteriota bacterium]
MHLLTITLALLLAHLVGDFVVQRDRVVAGKRRRSVAAYLEHACAHLLLSELALLAFVPATLSPPRTHALLVGLAATHALLDLAKARSEGGAPTSGTATAFLVDQVLHLLLLLGAAALIAEVATPLAAIAAWLQRQAAPALVLATSYCAALFAAGYANAVLLAPFAGRLRTADEADPSGLANAGKYIGWLERFLVLTAVLVGSPEAAGLVVAAKSVFRFGDIKEGRAFAEYFLIGTFLSVSEAVGIGLAARLLLGHLPAA